MVASKRLFRDSSEEVKHIYDTFKKNFEEIYHEVKNKSYGYQFAVKALLYRMISDIIRYSFEADGKKSQVFWNNVRDYVEDNYTKRIMVSDVASTLYMNKHYFERLFKKVVGKTFFTYLHEFRIRRAQILMLTTDMKIIEVAVNSGFSNLKSFNKLFKRVTGCTPSEYRKSTHGTGIV